MEWIDNPTDTTLAYKDTVAMVKTAHTTLLEHLEQLTGTVCS